MANKTLNTRVVLKVDTSTKWNESELILMKGEIGIEADTNKFKFGDGVKTYRELEYASARPGEVATVDPTTSDTGFDVGTMWLNTTASKVFILQSNDPTPNWIQLAKFTDIADANLGDMHKAVYDTDDNGAVDKADTILANGAYVSVNDDNTSGLWTATKTQQVITDGLALKADAATTYKKTEVDEKLDLKANVATTYSKTDVDGKLDLKADKTQLDSYILLTQKGANDGVATLDASGKIPTSQLPSYVSDVIESETKEAFPVTGEVNKIYVDKTTNKTYRWSGTQYTEISASIALGETADTAYAGDKGKQNATNIATLQGQVATLETTVGGLGKLAKKDTVAAADIDADAVTTVKILDANVTEGKLADSAVSTAKIANAAVTDEKIVTVDLAKITQKEGDVLILNCGDSTVSA